MNMSVLSGDVPLSKCPGLTFAGVYEFGSGWFVVDEMSYVVTVFQGGV
jgi:hypothetical protein